ncbi:hypothetical protein [uncultured Reyranella sp.]|uniref:hypothetical protein n=1 Tax=uncultured Reyranella sp. TaxID=735512 RepID=UPI00259C915F|nr:hypothetical protein [uncultured Reyranella sp.]
MTAVSQETLAQTKRRYHSPARRRSAEQTREALLDAAVELIAAGNFRPEAGAIAKRAGRHQSVVNRHFTALPLLYRVVARERSAAVLEALGIEPLDDARTQALQADLVWIAMTGRRRHGWA